MKRYTKDGKVKYRNEIVIRKDGKQIINPTIEMLIEDGWIEYVAPKLTEDELLERAKNKKSNDILSYDSSSEVNEFSIQGVPMWLDKATRAGLLLRFQAEEALGKDTTALWNNGCKFELPLATAQAMLYQLEAYASACYDNTQHHLVEVINLSTIEEVEAYDYTTGYPNKLEF